MGRFSTLKSNIQRNMRRNAAAIERRQMIERGIYQKAYSQALSDERERMAKAKAEKLVQKARQNAASQAEGYAPKIARFGKAFSSGLSSMDLGIAPSHGKKTRTIYARKKTKAKRRARPRRDSIYDIDIPIKL